MTSEQTLGRTLIKVRQLSLSMANKRGRLQEIIDVAKEGLKNAERLAKQEAAQVAPPPQPEPEPDPTAAQESDDELLSRMHRTTHDRMVRNEAD